LKYSFSVRVHCWPIETGCIKHYDSISHYIQFLNEFILTFCSFSRIEKSKRELNAVYPTHLERNRSWRLTMPVSKHKGEVSKIEKKIKMQPTFEKSQIKG
jgi:hypothetical protein